METLIFFYDNDKFKYLKLRTSKIEQIICMSNLLYLTYIVKSKGLQCIY